MTIIKISIGGISYEEAFDWNFGFKFTVFF